ncbi:hypothetical protein EL753P1_00033 [Eggerthella phage EL753P1]|nr:hypothetical protein EL753P1_00033 [Eggerthella phage EL753P1]
MVKFNDEMKKSGFDLMPEGVTVLKVSKMKPVMNQGKIKSYKGEFEDANGRKVWNDYTMNQKASYYLPSMRAFYSLLKTGCGLVEDENDEIDPEDAIGRYFVAKIKHTEKDDRTYVNLGYIIAPAESFNTDISEYTEKEAKRDKAKAEKAVKTAPVVEDDEDDDPYA